MKNFWHYFFYGFFIGLVVVVCWVVLAYSYFDSHQLQKLSFEKPKGSITTTLGLHNLWFIFGFGQQNFLLLLHGFD